MANSPIIYGPNGATSLVPGGVTLPGSTSGTLQVQPAAVTTSYGLVMPSIQGTANSILKNDGTGALSWAQGGAAIAPTITKLLTSGSGVYTPPTGVAYIEIELVAGGGGGGAGGSTGGTAGATGGTTSFGTSLLTATGGVGGTFGTNGSGNGAGGVGGTATINLPAFGLGLTGGTGGSGNSAGIGLSSVGASSPFGGAGIANATTAGTTGNSAIANTGSGGAGGTGAAGTNFGGGGGGSGAYIKAVITSPTGTYNYTVGALGAGGTGSTTLGGAGGSGMIVVREFYSPVVITTAAGGAVPPTVTKFPTAGTFSYTPPSGASNIRVTVIGGAGAGGGGSTASAGAGGGGGGAGGTSIGLINSAFASPYTVVVGVGSTGGIAGGTGTTGGSGSQSSFGGTLVIAGGGAGGTGGSGLGTPGTGGMGSLPGSGSEAYSGGSGASGTPGVSGVNGGYGGLGGGNSTTGTGGAGGTAGNIGTAGGSFGAAGGGGGGSANGGNGSSGYVQIEEFYANGAVGTATSITGSITASQIGTNVPTSNISGTTTNNNAAAGLIGEYIFANSAGVTPVASGSYANIASISLTAGDWDVEGLISFGPGATTASTGFQGGISLTSASLDSLTSGSYVTYEGSSVSSSPFGVYNISTGNRRVSIAATTTVYLVGDLAYTVLGTAVWSSFSIIRARRVR